MAGVAEADTAVVPHPRIPIGTATDSLIHSAFVVPHTALTVLTTGTPGLVLVSAPLLPSCSPLSLSLSQAKPHLPVNPSNSHAFYTTYMPHTPHSMYQYTFSTAPDTHSNVVRGSHLTESGRRARDHPRSDYA